MRRLFSSRAAVIAALVSISASPAFAVSANAPLKEVPWKFEGAFGHFDRASIQRGYQVYREVCSACHSMNLLSYRNLQKVGFSEEEVKTIAASYNVKDGPNDDGEMFERPARPSDRFVSPYANENAARAANNGALPPDLSLIVKARPNGANYVYSLLTGYGEKIPEHVSIPAGMHYNPYFPGGQIAMAAPLSDGQVQYQDGTAATLDQSAKDVVNFLQWAAEPETEHRKSMGLKVLVYLAVFTLLFYLAKKRIWKNVK